MSLTSIVFGGKSSSSNKPSVYIIGGFEYDPETTRVVVGRISSGFGTNLIIAGVFDPAKGILNLRSGFKTSDEKLFFVEYYLERKKETTNEYNGRVNIGKTGETGQAEVKIFTAYENIDTAAIRIDLSDKERLIYNQKKKY